MEIGLGGVESFQLGCVGISGNDQSLLQLRQFWTCISDAVGDYFPGRVGLGMPLYRFVLVAGLIELTRTDRHGESSCKGGGPPETPRARFARTFVLVPILFFWRHIET
jgi:hypothetical protein